jgi:hypothetical protein
MAHPKQVFWRGRAQAAGAARVSRGGVGGGGSWALGLGLRFSEDENTPFRP